MQPLAATWLMMAAEGPLLAALIARLAEPTFNLAAYGVAFSLALIIEDPVIMMMSASNALVGHRQSCRALRNFNTAIIAGVTAFMLILIVPGIFRFLTIDLLSLPEPSLDQLIEPFCSMLVNSLEPEVIENEQIEPM